MQALDGMPFPAVDEPMAFLIGGGCSHNLPDARRVIKALVEGVTEDLPEADDRLRSVLRRDVRFEFFFQTVRDVLGLELTCLAEVYGAANSSPDPSLRIPPTWYHHVLARVLNEANHTVVTTNFDLMFEDAYACQLPTPGYPLRVLSADDVDWNSPLAGHTLMKVHGSADDVDSLCATFDTVSSRGLGKHNAFTQVLKGKSLCVVGNGAWYDDVLQILLETDARDRFLYWFDDNTGDGIHNTGDGIWHRFKDIDTASAGADRPRRILKSLVRKRHQLANRVFLIEGETETLFKAFLNRVGIDTSARSSIPVYDSTRHGSLRARLNDQVSPIVRRWLAGAEDDSGFWRRLTCIDLAYVHNVSRAVDLSGLASEVRTQMEDDDLVKRSLGWPRVAKAAYDEAEEDHQFKGVITHSEQAIAASKMLIAKKSDADPAHVAALLDSYGWKAEAQRMLDDCEAALHTCKEAKQQLRSWLRDADAQRGKLLLRALGGLLNTEAETRLALGQLGRARRTYSRAAAYYRDGGDLIWLLYARLGQANATQLAGHLTKAEQLYLNLEMDIDLTGPITYLMDWLLLHRIDAWRVKVALGSPMSKWSDWRNRVEDTIKGIGDLAARERATATALELRWMGLEREDLLAAKAEYENIEHEYRKLMAANPDNDITAGLALSYADS